MKGRTVAIIGRPNVGKSRLFNRLVGKRISIVHDQAGVTRDVIAEESADGDYTLLDTGGIGFKPDMTEEEIHEATEEQVEFAVQAADLLLFVVDGKDGLMHLDKTIAEKLRTFGKEIRIVVNKMDGPNRGGSLDGYYEAALGEPIGVSAEHDYGIAYLSDKIIEVIGHPPEVKAEEPSRIPICLAGRPNVGKSSLGNALIESKRLVVSDVPGTTRDAVKVDIEYPLKNGEKIPFRLVDTAGLRAKKKIKSSLDYFSSLRSSGAIDEAETVFLVLDAREGVTRFEQQLAGNILTEGKSLAIIVNKWDLALDLFAEDPPPEYKSEKDFKKAFLKSLKKELFFVPESPILFVSAKKGIEVDSILRTAHEIHERLNTPLPTVAINRLLEELTETHPPKVVHGKRFKIYYAVQIGTRPVRIRFYCNRETKIDDGYIRFLHNRFHERFELSGCPIVFELVGKERRYSQEEK